MSDPFLGEIRMVGFNFAPSGWALCSGQTMSIAQNQALFALLGTTYGGDGVTTFVLPNLQGRSPVGVGSGLGLSTVALGQIGGSENVTLTVNQMPAHTHIATSSGGVTASGSVAIPATTATTNEGGTPGPTTVLGPITASGRAGSLYSTATPNTTLLPFNVTVQGNGPAVQNSPAGGGMPTPLRNPYLGINFVIALSGIFPPRP